MHRRSKGKQCFCCFFPFTIWKVWKREFESRARLIIVFFFKKTQRKFDLFPPSDIYMALYVLKKLYLSTRRPLRMFSIALSVILWRKYYLKVFSFHIMKYHKFSAITELPSNAPVKKISSLYNPSEAY